MPGVVLYIAKNKLRDGRLPLREVILATGLTRQAFADLLGVPKTKLNNWDQLRSSPNAAEMARLLELTGLEEERFLFRSSQGIQERSDRFGFPEEIPGEDNTVLW